MSGNRAYPEKSSRGIPSNHEWRTTLQDRPDDLEMLDSFVRGGGGKGAGKALETLERIELEDLIVFVETFKGDKNQADDTWKRQADDTWKRFVKNASQLARRQSVCTSTFRPSLCISVYTSLHLRRKQLFTYTVLDYHCIGRRSSSRYHP